MKAWDDCPSGKNGRHNLMAFFHPEDAEVPVTAICCNCGMSHQYPLQWTGEGSLDSKTAEEIAEAIRPRA